MNPLRRFKGNLLILLALAVADLLTVAHFTSLGLVDILWTILVIPILGSLCLSLLFKAEKFDYQEWLIYCVGAGLVALMIIGLFINTVGLELNHPVLRRQVVLPVINAVMIILVLIRARLLLSNPHKKLFPTFTSGRSILQIVRIFIPLCLPLLATIGAVRLNNGGSDSLAITALLLICAYPVILLLFTKKLFKEEIITSLFSVSLALALSVSMRSNYLIGYDIHQEFEVFSAAVKSGIWYPHLYSNAYNACLSITVLPAFLKALMPISSEYLFKFIMQFIFGIMPIIVFVIANHRLKQKRYAYLAALFFIVQGPFIFEFPGLIRQQIGLIFFGLIFASAMSSKISKTAKSALLILFGIAMVTSHYSTTYVTIALLLLLVILKPFFIFLRDGLLKNSPYRGETREETNWYISPILVLIILLMAFLWYGETLQATGGVVQKVESSITKFSSVFKSDSHSDFVTTTFGLGGFIYTSQTLEHISDKYSVSGGYKPPASQYQPQPASPNGASVDSSLKDIFFNFEHKVVPLFAGTMVAIGLLIMFCSALFNRGNLEDGLFATGAGCLFILLALLPNISQDYNLERLYQQLLVLLSPAYIVGFIFIFKRWLKPKILLVLIVATTVIYLIGTTGLIDQFTFGISNINLINDGVNYDHYYTTNGEMASLLWLQGISGSNKVNLDRYSILDAEAYTTIPINRMREGVFPSEIRPNGYVYASSANINKGLAFDIYQNNVITFTFPQQYLSNNKDTVYVNQDSEIYK